MEQFNIEEKFLASVIVKFEYTSKGLPCGTMSSTDHPSFAALRRFLAAKKFIEIEEKWINGDRVLTMFSLNGKIFKPGEGFPSAGAMLFALKNKKNFHPELYP